MLREIRLDVILLVVLMVVVTLFVLNATSEFGPLKTGEFGVPPDWNASREFVPPAEVTPEATQEATLEVTEDVEATPEATLAAIEDAEAPSEATEEAAS